jgi:hypothetical protein
MNEHDDSFKTRLLVGGLFLLVATAIAAIALMIS